MGFLKCLNYNVLDFPAKEEERKYNGIKEVSVVLSVNHKRRRQRERKLLHNRKIREILRKMEIKAASENRKSSLRHSFQIN